MKKMLCVILTVFILSNTLYGCIDKTEQQLESSSEEEVSNITENWSKTDVLGIYKADINVDLPDNHSLSADINAGVMLLKISCPGMDTSTDEVRLIDINNGKVLSITDFTDGNRRFEQLQNGGFNALSFDDGTLTEYSTSGASSIITTVENVQLLDGIVSPDGSFLFYQPFNSDQQPKIIDTCNNITIAVDEAASFGNLLGTDNTSFFIEDNNRTVWKIGHDGTAVALNNRLNTRIVSPYIIESNDSGYILQNMSTSNLLSFAVDTINDYIVSAGNGVLLSQNGDSFRLYDILGYRCTDLFNLSGQYLTSIYSDDGYFAVLCDLNGKLSVSILMASEMQYPNNLRDTGGTYDGFEEAYFDMPEIDSEISETIKSIHEKYHVRIILKSERFRDNICGYSNTDIKEEDIKSKVNAVNEFLSLFPDGMMLEINNGADVWLYLCNELQDTDGNCVEGFATMFSGHPFVAVETVGKEIYFKELLAHEFCHLFDYGISAEWISNWENLSPKDGYCYSTTGVSGKYSLYNTDGSEVYFYDVYSTTSPAEDRAVIFQKLFYEYASEEFNSELHKGHLAEKVSFMRNMLRTNYSSCNEAENLFWE